MERKLAFLRQFLSDLGRYGALDGAARLREHYAIERLLQLLCESAADVALQVCKAGGYPLAASYRDVFLTLAVRGELPRALADRLVDACGMRNVLTHLYDVIDLDRVIAAVEPAAEVYREFLDWALQWLERADGQR
jgi:uncharacterized protein YutE (UPF0331/DUF86 family)